MTLLLTIALAVTAPDAPPGPSGVELAAALHAAPQVAGSVSFRTPSGQREGC